MKVLGDYKNLAFNMRHLFLTIIILGMLIATVAHGQTGNGFALNVVWKTETYVPPGFAVKPLPVAGSVVTFTALTPTQNPANINFTWVIEDSSFLGQGPVKRGAGEDTFVLITNPNLPSFTHKIKVLARNTQTGAEAVARVELALVLPEAHLYFGSSGPFGRRVANRFNGVPGTSGVLTAQPFYFNVGGLGDLVFSWIFDGRVVPAGAEPARLNLTITPDTAAGTQRPLSLTVTNRLNERERARVTNTLRVLSP